MDNLQAMRASSNWSKRMTRLLSWLAVAGVCVLVFLAVRFVLDAYWNAERLKDVQALTVALRQYAADHSGAYPAGLDAEDRQLGSASFGCEITTSQCMITISNCLDLGAALKPYLAEIPADPVKWGKAKVRTRYAATVDRNGGLLVTACDYSK